VEYSYDPAGNRSQRTTYYGAYTDYSYNALNQLSSQASYFANGYIARYNYGYDINNRATYEQRNLGVADGFGYDPRNQVTAYQHDGTLNQDGSVTGGYNIGISYDANGNRIAATEACCVAPYNTAPNNQYVSDWTGTLPYDANANLTGRAGWGFSYDAQDRLVSIDSGGTHIHYHYDPLNRIVARDTDGDITTNIWDNWNLLEERTSGDGLRRLYFWGAASNEIVISWGPAYGDVTYFQDGRGNVTHLTGPGNNVIEHYTYFPLFGQPTIDDGYGNLRGSSIVDNRFLFKGALFVPGPDIYDMRNRFFLPNLGRFMQSDPLGFDGGDMNLFRYCGNDPVNGSDPSGEIAPVAAVVARTLLLNAAVGAGIDLGVQLWAHDGDWHAVNWREVGISGAVGAVGGGFAFAFEKQIASISLRLALNGATGAALGAGGQIGVNASSGQPWYKNVLTAAAYNGALGVGGAALSELPAWARAARAARAWNAASVEKRALGISNAITSFTDNASIWPGVAQGAGIGLSNAYPFFDNPFEGRPDEPSSTSLQYFGGYDFGEIFRAGLYHFENPLLDGKIDIGPLQGFLDDHY
jgi:RHS repeat-associated protein